MSPEMETLRVAERAADWLVRLDTARPNELAEFWNWLMESPLHVQEMLAAQACHIELDRAFKNGRIARPLSNARGQLNKRGNEEPPQLLRDVLLDLLRLAAQLKAV